MKTLLITLAIIISLIILWTVLSLTRHGTIKDSKLTSFRGYETPRYEIIDQEGPVEIRQYESFLVIQVEQKGGLNQTAGSAFGILGGYIFGNNQEQQQVPMTTPVMSTSADDGQGYTVAFIVPSDYDVDSLPTPQDARIQTYRYEAGSYASYSFRRWVSEAKAERKRKKLIDRLADSKRKPVSDNLIVAQYDDPFVAPRMRRNEILVPVRTKEGSKEVEMIQEVNMDEHKSHKDPIEQLYPILQSRVASGELAVATFAAGCFWCTESYFQETAGVEEAVSGFAGGTAPDPSYEDVAYGRTDYREAVQVFYDPAQVSYEELLAIFWRTIDPTDAGGQYVDRGPHYTTAVYYGNDTEKTQADASRQQLVDDGVAVVTEVLPFSTFYPAEEYHQDFYLHSAQRYQRYKKGSGRES